MTKLKWEDEFVFYLIDEVHKCEYMWKSKSPLHRKKSMRREFWLRLAKKMNHEFRPNTSFTYEEMVKKWNNLRCYYTAANQRFFKAQQNGASVEELENIQSSWKFKSKLDFLLTNSDPTRSLSRFNKEGLENLHDDFEIKYSNTSDFSCGNSLSAFYEHEMAKEFSISPSCIKSERSSLSDEPMLHEDESRSILQKCRADTTKPKENSAFGFCVSSEIDKLSADLQITAKKQIFSIIMDLQDEQLKRKRK